MVLYLCLIPNHGGGIGHQSHDHFTLVSYCEKNNLTFVYHPFTGKSKKFESVLNFGSLYPYHYNNVCNQVDKIINIKELNIDIKDLHQKLLELHNSEIKFLLFDTICGNENYYTSFNINNSDIINVKKKYRSVLLKYYNKPVLTEYICIHIRCGDIKYEKSR